jgi:hypothetical protein
MYPPGPKPPRPSACEVSGHTPSWVSPGYHWLRETSSIDKGHPRRIVVIKLLDDELTVSF